MAGEVWLKRAAVGLESTYGVAVPATRRAYWRNPQLTRERNYRPRQYATGHRADTVNARLGPVVAGGRYEEWLSADEMVEPLLVGVHGGVTPAALGGGAYQWDFQPGDGPLDSETIEGFDGANFWQEYGTYMNTLRLAGNAGATGDNLLTMEMFAKERVLLGSPALDALPIRVPTLIEGWETKAYIDNFGIYGTTLVPHAVVSWDIQIRNNLGRKYFADNTLETGKVVVGRFEVEATFRFEASESVASTEYTNWDNSTKRTVELVFGTNEQVGTSGFYRSVRLSVSGAWSLMNTNQEAEGTQEYEARLSGIFDPAYGDMCHWQLVNARPTAFSAS